MWYGICLLVYQNFVLFMLLSRHFLFEVLLLDFKGSIVRTFLFAERELNIIHWERKNSDK